MFLEKIRNNIATLAIDTSGLQGIVDEVSSTLDVVLGVLIGLVGLAAICVSIVFLIKAGFTSEPEKRSKNLKAIMWLWVIVLVIAGLWGLKEGIIAVVRNSIN